MKLKTTVSSKTYIDRIDAVIIYVFLVTTAYVRIVENNAIILTICSVCLFSAGLINVIRIIRNKELGIIAFILLLIFTWIVELIGRPEWCYDYKFLISSISYVGIAYSFLTNKRRIQPYAILFYVLSFYVIFEVLVLKVSYREIMKEGSSYNFLTILILFYILLLNFVEIQNKKEPRYLTAGLFLLLSIVVYGRAGILSATIYFVLLLGTKAIYHKRRIKTYIMGIIIIGLIIFFGGVTIDRLLKQGVLDKFLYYGMSDNGRVELWNSYLTTCTKSAWSLLMGGDPRVLEYIDYNTHNVFLQLYASFGLITAVIVICFFIERICSMVYHKRLWILLLIATFLTRALTDKLMYRGYHEVLFNIFLFYAHTNAEKAQIKELDKYVV